MWQVLSLAVSGVSWYIGMLGLERYVRFVTAVCLLVLAYRGELAVYF